MISYRTFLNGDLPSIVDIWRDNRKNPGFAATMTMDTFDQLILSKPYFERKGLILALERDQPIGFAHAGFGPTDDESNLDYRRGVVSMLLVKQDCNKTEVATELLRQSEDYLQNMGAEEIFAGGVGAVCPFYLGLYGGSDLPGILDADTSRKHFYESHGYEEVDHALRFGRDLTNFRPSLDRALLSIRRAFRVDFLTDPPSRSWWDACNQGCFLQIRADLVPTAGGPPVASAVFWDMETLVAGERAQRTSGICNIKVQASESDTDMARYLLIEALRHLQIQGFMSIQGLAMYSDSATIDLLTATGFEQIGGGAVLRKTCAVLRNT